MKLLLTMLFVLCVYLPLRAQTYEVPKNYSLVKKEDYAPFEQDVIKTVDWLAQSPWKDDVEKRREANAFLMKWLEGSPNVSVDLGDTELKLTKKNPELLMSFMGAYAKYVIEHKQAIDKKAAKTVAIKALIDKYANESSHVKDASLEKLVKIDKEGKLNEWITAEYKL